MSARISAVTPADHDEYLHVILAGICALVLTVGLARFAYTPMLPIMRNEAGLSHLAGGWLATSNYAGYMTGALLAASFGNIHHKFLLYRVWLVTALLSTVAMGLTTEPLLWAILRFVSGLASTAGLLLASGLVLNWLMRMGHRPELGLHFIGLGLGIAVSGLAVVAMAEWLAWDALWIGLGVLGVVFFLPAWHWMPAPASPGAGVARDHEMPKPPSRRWLRLFIAAYFCAGFGFVISATFIVTILEDLPLLTGRGGWVWVIVGLAATPSCFLWDRIASASGTMKALMLAYALQTLSVILPAVTHSTALNLFSAALFGGTFVGIVSLTLTLIGRHFPVNPAKAMAQLTLSYGCAQIMAPAMAGYIATVTNSYQGSLLITTLVMATGMFLLKAIMKEEQRAQAEAADICR